MAGGLAAGRVGSAGGAMISVAAGVTRGCDPVSGTMNSQIGGAGLLASVIRGAAARAGSTPQSQRLIHAHMTLVLHLAPKSPVVQWSQRLS
ncbi:MAG: hypothetical protein B7Y80_21020 [Hyphomicrobium sp. 32-62-53]|nr:MAG: hypothetical protein B7Z29_20880 [Hyphomicrobium sp. 12-62-95]OYX97051.1 MAG: hypothetical protein B7Y80_21020 [Hyphomicrobium sp. 32-62-53]